MSDKKWSGDGIYSRVQKDHDGQELEVYFARIWLPTVKKMKCANLGLCTSPTAAREKKQIERGPEA